MSRAICRDELCLQPIVFQDFQRYVSCNHCGQNHDTSSFDTTEGLDSVPDVIKPILTSSGQARHPQRGPDLIRVLGLSHYHEKLVSPLLTAYGMDKHTGKARPLRQLTGRPALDCSVFGDRSFSIEKRHLHITGFGKDSAAEAYLADTLEMLKDFNDNRECLVPLYADGDGHCLIHSVSRAITGRELFWHPLRIGLKQHFYVNLDKYKAILGSFINNAEWQAIIDECEPEYMPTDGILGLRNTHIFGLANLLRRPIILIDSKAGMKMSADYAAVFLPGLNPPMACRNKAGQFNPPICIGWSSAARNHFVPLVPVKEYLPVKFPRNFLPKVWGLPQNLLDTYIKFDDNNCLVIGGEATLSQMYLVKLTASMDDLFLARNGVPPAVVADLYFYQYSNKLMSEPKVDELTEVAATTLRERRLLRCLACSAVCVVPLSSQWLIPGGLLYTAARKVLGYLTEDHVYPFPNYGVTCRYNTMRDTLYVTAFDPFPCTFCHSLLLRQIKWDGSVDYQNGDITTKPVEVTSNRSCTCGYKHWWNGKEYDNPPVHIPISFTWNGVQKQDTVVWFHNESEPDMNSNAFEVASELLSTHCPGEPDLESLRQDILRQLFEFIKDKNLQEMDEALLAKRALPAVVVTETRKSPSRKRSRSPLDGLPPTKQMRSSPGPSTSKDCH